MAAPSDSAATGEAAALPDLVLPEMTVAHVGWGPTSLPADYAPLPYAPFNKSDRLGKVADFTHKRRFDRWGDRWDKDAEEEDEDGPWGLVDTAKAPRKFDPRRRMQRRPQRFQPWRDRQQQEEGKQGGHRLQPRRTGKQRKRLGHHRRRDAPKIVRSLSVNVESTWDLLEQIELPVLGKSTTKAPTVKDVKWCGRLDAFDEKYTRVTTKTATLLNRFEDRMADYVSTRWDPVIQECAKSGIGNVFATDAILSHIMCAPRSVFPWDIVVTYMGGRIFLDVRDAQEFEFLTVNETAHEPPSEEADDKGMNSQASLSLEATMINFNFSQQVTKRGSDATSRKYRDIELEENPLWEEEDSGKMPASTCYRYRQFQLGEDISLVARTSLHGVTPKRDKLLTIFALNEWDSKSFSSAEWRKLIDNQRGAVLSTEVKNNAMKLAKWTAQTLLSGADQMQLGYVSRAHARDKSRHFILATHPYRAKSFAQELGLDENSMWGVVKWVVATARTHAAKLAEKEDKPLEKTMCKFVLLRDPNEAVVRFFKVPMESFEPSEDEESSEEESSEEESSDEEGTAVAAGAGTA